MDFRERLSWCLMKEIPYEIKKVGLEYGVGFKEVSELIYSKSQKTLFKYKEYFTELQLKKIQQEADRELEICEKEGISLLFLNDDDYPIRLKNIPNPPLLLFIKGSIDLNMSRTMSVVGTRNATIYGKKICEDLMQSFQNQEIAVFSGLASGIDSFAHSEALKVNLPTWGILGHGLHTIYPSESEKLADEILNKQGGLISEYPFHTPINKWQFPMRNRIIAGISDVTLVVEANKKGGALITAKWANEFDREVCVFPGNIYQHYSEGNNHLIKNQLGHLVENAEDIAKLMQWDILSTVEEKFKRRPKLESIKFSEDIEKQVFEKIKTDIVWNIHDLSNSLDIEYSKLYEIVWRLKERDLIEMVNSYTLKIII